MRERLTGSAFRRFLKGGQPPLMLGLQLRATEEQRNQYASQRFLQVVAGGAVFSGSEHVPVDGFGPQGAPGPAEFPSGFHDCKDALYASPAYGPREAGVYRHRGVQAHVVDAGGPILPAADVRQHLPDPLDGGLDADLAGGLYRCRLVDASPLCVLLVQYLDRRATVEKLLQHSGPFSRVVSRADSLKSFPAVARIGRR
jgi:hypothetical protein